MIATQSLQQAGKPLLLSCLFFIFLTIQSYGQSGPPVNRPQNTPHPDSLIAQGEKLIRSSDKLKQAEGYFTIASGAMRKNKLDVAIENLEKAEALSTAGPMELKIRILRTLASTTGRAEKYDKLSTTADKIIELAESQDDKLLYAMGLSYRARSQMKQGDLNKAADNHLAAAKIFDSLNSPNLITTYSDLAHTYARLYQNEEAARWFKRAYEEALQKNEPRLLEMATKNLAANYGIRKMPDSSVYYYNKLLENERTISPLQRSSIYQNLASAYISLDKLDLAKANLKKATLLSVIRPQVLIKFCCGFY